MWLDEFLIGMIRGIYIIIGAKAVVERFKIKLFL